MIGVASLVSVWFLLALIDKAMSVWPWWLWLGLGLGTAFILLVPARRRLLGSLRSPNARQRWVAIGGVSLLALFILAGMGSAVFREFEDWRYRRSLQAAANEVSADSSGVAGVAGNAVNAASGGGIAPVVVPTDTPAPAPAPAAAPPAEPECGQPTNFRAGALNTNDRSLIYSWDAPARSDLTVTGYQTESREALADGTYTDWRPRDALGAGEIYQAVGPFSSDIDGRTFQNRVYAVCGSVYSEPSDHVLFTYPAAVTAAVPTDTPAPTPTPEPTPAPEPTDTPSPTATLIPPSTPTPAPLATRTPTQWLVQHPADPKITGASPGTHVLVQGCYLGTQTSARRFRLASWDVWDAIEYGGELKFVKIITNTGARLSLEPGSCYEATVVKQTDSHEEYVCMDLNSTHPEQTPCADPREHEIIPTFILHPNSPDDPDNYSDNFSVLTTPTLRPPR